MAFTTEPTFADNVVFTAADANTYIRDNVNYLKGKVGPVYLEDALEQAKSAAPSTPASGFGRIFIGNASPRNGIAACVDDAGNIYQMLTYVTGTFTPAIVGSGTAGTFTYDSTNTKAEYTRIGDRVMFNGRLRITATSVAPTGNLSITGFPLTTAAGTNNGNVLGGANVMAATAINLVAGYTQLQGYFGNAVTSMFLVETGDNVNLAVVQGGELATTADIYFWGNYRV